MKSIERMIEESNLSASEIRNLLKSKPKPSTGRRRKHKTSSDTVTFGVLSDLHIGHKNYRPDVLQDAIKNFDKRGVEFVCIPGDIMEGMSGRDGHIYELSHIGASAQMEYAIDQLSQIEQQKYFIIASNSHDGWFNSKGNMGYDVSKDLEKNIPDMHFLGNDEGDLDASGMHIRLTHPGDGTAYAISYKAQKYANALSGGQKPNIVLEGHYHKSMYMFYRNMHMFEAGTLEDQTIFMKKKQTPAHVGYWIVEAEGGKHGVDRITPEFHPFYE